MRHSEDKNAKLDVTPAIASFYMHEEIIHTPIPRTTPFKLREIKRLKERVIKHQEEYCKFLSRALFDYLCAASYGESRHADERCEVMHPDVMVGGSRNEAYEEAKIYNPKNYLKTLSNLYNKNRWEDGYGGKPWGTITDHAINYFSMSPRAFIDYVVDLSHNGGVAFDKPIVLQLMDITFYKFLLDVKLKGSLMTNWIERSFKFMSRHHKLEIDSTTYCFMTEACRYGLFNSFAIQHISSARVEFPEPIEWGEDELYSDDFIDSSGSSNRCDECGDKIPEDDYHSTDDHIYCYSCFHENYDYCYHCGEVVYKEEAEYVTDYGYYCECCYESKIEEDKENEQDDGFKGNSQELAVHKMRTKFKTETGRS